MDIRAAGHNCSLVFVKRKLSLDPRTLIERVAGNMAGSSSSTANGLMIFIAQFPAARQDFDTVLPPVLKRYYRTYRTSGI